MALPEFSTLPTINAEDWFPKPIKASLKALDTTRKATEAKRNDVHAAVAKARSADLAEFSPVRVDVLPALQSELVFRRSFSEFLRDMFKEAEDYKRQCDAEVHTAEDAVKTRLIDMGYSEPPAGGGVSRGSFGPDWVARHIHVLDAKSKANSVEAFVDRYQQTRRENNQQVETLTNRLSALRDSVIS